jgi:hypothetical protein
MKDNAQKYPRLANVIFEGDNSDSIATMASPASINGARAIGRLFGNAMRGRFQDAESGSTMGGETLGTWTGKIFLDGFDDTSTVPRPGFYGDAGYAMFGTDYNDFLFAPERVDIVTHHYALATWSNWP